MYAARSLVLGLAALFAAVPTAMAQSSGRASASGSVTASASGSAQSGGSSVATATSTAHFPSLTGISTCVVNCLEEAAANATCTTITDVNCYCVNRTFAQEIFSCVASECSSDLPTAEALAQQFCNAASSAISLSFPSTSLQSASGLSFSISTATVTSVSVSASSLPVSATAPGASGSATGVPNGAARLAGPNGSGAFSMGLVIVGMLAGAMWI